MSEAKEVSTLSAANKALDPYREELRKDKPNEVVKRETLDKDGTRKSLLVDLPEAIHQLNQLRKGNAGKNRRPLDLSLAEFAHKRYGFALEANERFHPDKRKGERFVVGAPNDWLRGMGINPNQHSLSDVASGEVANLFSIPNVNEGLRFLVPELFRDALRLGIRKTPIFNRLIVAEETVSQQVIQQPYIEKSDSRLRRMQEGASIRMGEVNFGQKSISVAKYGTGIKMSDEVTMFSTLNTMSIFLEDVGVDIGYDLTQLALSTLIAGDGNANSTVAAPGVADKTKNAEYQDILDVWLHMNNLGRQPKLMVAKLAETKRVMELPEFKALDGTPLKRLQLAQPLPEQQEIHMHEAIPANNILFVDTDNALMQHTVMPLTVEYDRNVGNSYNAMYAKIHTGFSILFRDARVLLDGTENLVDAAWPAWMTTESVEDGNGFEN